MTTAKRLPNSIATVCLSGTPPDKMDAAAALGFDGVEIFENDLLTFDGTPAEVQRMVELRTARASRSFIVVSVCGAVLRA